MSRKFGIGILILCFVLSSVNAGLAAPAGIAQPYDLSAINLQVLELVRENQEQELAIRGLLDENQKLANAPLIDKQNTTLEKINKVLVNTQRVSKYYDLIKLTEDTDDMTGSGQYVVLKRDVIEEKYKILTDLKNEMIALNKKLKDEAVYENPDKLDHQQEDKIQVLTQRLGEMDEKITHDSEILAEKDQQIAQLIDNLARVQSAAATKKEMVKSQKNQVNIVQEQSKEISLYPTFSLELPPIYVNTPDNQQQAEPEANPVKDQSAVYAKAQTQALDLKTKDDSIRWLQQVLTVAKNKAEYYKLTSQQDQLSMQKIQREVQDIKGDFARHSKDYDHFENAIASLKGQASQLSLQLSQKQAQVDLLKDELENKITEGKAQSMLAKQVQDLTAQLQDKQDQINTMKAKIQAGQETKQEEDSLKQQLATQQDKADQLKQQLDIKTAQSDQMTLMVDEYQKKLESKDNAYNEQLRQILSSKNYPALLEKQIADLNARLQEKEAQVVKIKEDMYDLQKLSISRDRESQEKDLSLSIMQQKIIYLRTELALGGKQPNGMPDSDEINFLRTAFKQASAQLEQKDAMYHQIKANADEYEKEFKEQTKEFQSLKDQLQDAQQGIKRMDEDLKYKDMEIIRVKELSRASEKDLKAQVMVLTRKLESADKRSMSNTHENKVKTLQAQLKKANSEIGDLQAQLNQLGSLPANDTIEKKLKQALDEMDKQGQMISVLNQKLQDCEQKANPTSKSP